MVRNSLRRELEILLTASREGRRPAIRRSLKDEWLYATDIPKVYITRIPDLLRKALTSAGWEYIQEGDWLQLRKTVQEPPDDWYTGSFGPEAACCLSLLRRHMPVADSASDLAQRMLIKAGEQGEKAYEDACAILHRHWAERLRQGIPLPAVSLRYFEKQ